MKKCLILASIILFITVIPVSAHPGSTDENGGHHDRDNGEYHYHHGYPAHQHTDGVCPYDYDDKTNHGSGSGTRSSNSTSYTNNNINRTTQAFKGSSVDTIVYVSNGMYHSLNCPIKGKNCVERKLIDVYNEGIPGCTTCVLPRLTYSQIDEYNATHKPTPSPSPTAVSEERNKPKELYDWEPVFRILTPIFIIWLLQKIIRTVISNQKDKRKKAIYEKNLSQSEYNYYFSAYAFYDPLMLAGTPKGSYVIDDLPVTEGNGKYGKYTVYVSSSGKCFHQSRTCSHYLTPTNYVYTYNKQPCKKCVKSIPEIQWFKQYMHIVKIKKKYMIP